MSYEPQEIESEWRDRWDEAGRYEADPADDPDGEATFVTVPYPYPSGGMHIGHARTYTVPDVYARYRRLQGDNVLFPIAWHVTGTPIVGAVERLKNEDPEQIESLQDAFGVPREDLQSLETPMGFARYFIEEAESSYKTGMRGLGLSIDWRREFTTNDDRYSKFVQWQYRTLKQRGLLEKGLHPVKYCTNEDNPVTTHDLLEGEEADYQEYTLVKFRDADLVVPMATLRPETVRGVTNAYVDPEAEYATAEVDDEHWLVSAAATEKLRLQARDVEVHETFSGSDLVGERLTNPVTGDEILVLPADFVDADNATGVVMSVPAHSPDDYLALQEAKADHERLERYGIDPAEVADIEPVPILEIDDYGEIPARDAVEAAGIEAADDPELEAVTADLYQDEFHAGRLLDSYGEFAGEVISGVRERFREHHADAGAFDAMYEFSEDVVCRCGGDVEVAEQDTWFLRYGDDEWTAKTRRAIENLEAIPESTREQYDHTVDWLEEWPCIRNYGLGTRLPWDDEFVIEPLSDSTIYMSYYTIAHRIEDVPLEEIDDDFFDTLLLDDGDHDRAAELREEWDYWYPVDYRCSGNDLIQNHLTFYLYHHAELFSEPKWPQGITVMGMGLLEGRKMSSSKGHVVLPGEAIDEYGADTVRFFLLNSAEPWQDYDWREDQVQSTRDDLERFYERGVEIAESAEIERDLQRVDRWLLAKLQDTVATVTEAMDSFETRTASQAAFYDFREHLKWYRRRIASDEAEATGLDRPGARWTLRRVLETRLRLLAPFVPFLANDLHERLTGEPAEDAAWPSVDDEFADDRVVAEEQLVKTLQADVREVVDVTGTEPDRVEVYVAADWKREVFDTVREVGADRGQVMSEVMSDPDLRERGDAVNDLVGDLVELVRERSDDQLGTLAAIDETGVYEDAADFLAAEFDAEVVVASEAEAEDPGRADSAVPFRPAIHLA
jgi:leucyl-tRNA synthetase